MKKAVGLSFRVRPAGLWVAVVSIWGVLAGVAMPGGVGAGFAAAAEPLRLAQAAPLPEADAFELTFWNTIKDSRNPDDFRAYLEAYPNGRFAPLARVRARGVGTAAGAGGAEGVTPLGGEFVAVDTVPVRARPATDAPRLGGLDLGERVLVTGQVPGTNWLRIMRKNGQIAFVPREGLKAADQSLQGGGGSGSDAAAVPARGSGDTVRDCPECPELVRIAAGSFDMGSNEFFDFEKPVHKVTISRPFFIARSETTLAEWDSCAAEGGCVARANPQGDPNLPVTDVTFGDAKAYAAWLSRKSGRTYRLPTEAEWEYAARGGTNTTYYWGKTLVKERANCAGCGTDTKRSPNPVGSFPANNFGLFDMAGNAAEWVEDCWNDNYKGAPVDGSAWLKGPCRERVLRGGSFINDPRYVRSAARFKYEPDVRYYGNGFRVLREE
jgi:formylglycine-generating enzyme required for sulfatase activity